MKKLGRGLEIERGLEEGWKRVGRELLEMRMSVKIMVKEETESNIKKKHVEDEGQNPQNVTGLSTWICREDGSDVCVP